MVFENGPVNFTKKTIPVTFNFRLLAGPAGFVLPRIASFTGTAEALRKATLARLGQFGAQCLGS